MSISERVVEGIDGSRRAAFAKYYEARDVLEEGTDVPCPGCGTMTWVGYDERDRAWSTASSDAPRTTVNWPGILGGELARETAARFDPARNARGIKQVRAALADRRRSAAAAAAHLHAALGWPVDSRLCK